MKSNAVMDAGRWWIHTNSVKNLPISGNVGAIKGFLGEGTFSKATYSQGDTLFLFILEGNRPAGLFCAELVTFGSSPLHFARQFSPALGASNNFADTKDVSYGAATPDVLLIFSLFFLLLFSLFLLCTLGTPAVCKAPDKTSSGLPAFQEIPWYLD